MFVFEMKDKDEIFNDIHANGYTVQHEPELWELATTIKNDDVSRVYNEWSEEYFALIARSRFPDEKKRKANDESEEVGKPTAADLDEVPFQALEEVYLRRKRLRSTVDLTIDHDDPIEPDGSGAALKIQVQQNQTLAKVKVEKAAQFDELRSARKLAADLKSQADAAKKAENDLQLNLERMKECVVCEDADKCIALFPCSHLVLCDACKDLVNECPICRGKIDERRKIKIA